MWAQGRWSYLAVVLDLYSRRVVGWAMSTKPDAELVIKALDRAYEMRGRPRGVLFHIDQGSQYGSRSFRQRLWRYRMTQSMTRRGNCYDNASMERLFHSLETEWVPAAGYRRQRWPSRTSAATSCSGTTGLGRISTTVSYRRRLRKTNSILCPGIVNHYKVIPRGKLSGHIISLHVMILRVYRHGG